MSQGIDNSETWAADKVFAIEELREEILKYAMYDNLGKISGKMVGTVRVVNKSWLQSTTKLFRKNKESVVELSLDDNDSLRNTKNVKINELVETFGASARLQDSFLPVKLDIRWGFFRERNYQSLADCFTRLGNDLVEIEVNYPRNGGTMPVTFKPFSLPKLRKLSFEFSGYNREFRKVDPDDEDVFGNQQNGLGLLQTILNASNSITALTFTDVVPVGFKYLQLPVTISNLNMSAEMKSKDLEVLLRNQLPNLSHLTLAVDQVSFQNGLLFRVLERFQYLLQTLEIQDFFSYGLPPSHIFLRLPLMKKLKEIEVSCTECELDPENNTNLHKVLPELTVVKLMNQTKANLAKWIQDSRFTNVGQLCISVVNEELDGDDSDDSYYMSLDPVTMIQLQQTFPNVWSLSITVNISDLASLKYVFQDMAQLKTLKIRFSGDEAVLDASSDLIDSTFLGLPLGLVVALKESMHVLDTGKIMIRDGGEPSIRNISGLISLTLETNRWANGASLISNLLFWQAFMKMTTLRKLDLHDKFKLTLEMEEEWNGHGRFF